MPRCRNSVATTTSDDQPHIGNYRLLKTIGKGNFAKVKLARHILTGKEVSISSAHMQVWRKKSVKVKEVSCNSCFQPFMSRSHVESHTIFFFLLFFFLLSPLLGCRWVWFCRRCSASACWVSSLSWLCGTVIGCVQTAGESDPSQIPSLIFTDKFLLK